MKNIKYILVLLISVSIFSCSEDDSFSRAYVDNEVKTDLVGSISVNQTLAYATTMIDFDYTLPQSFSSESTLEVTLESSFNSLDINRHIEKVFVTVPAGSTSGSGSFEMPNPSGAVADFDGIPEFISARLSGIALTQPEDGSVDDPFTLTSDSVSIGLLEFHDPFMVARPNTLMMSLDWEGPYSANDLDLYVFNSSGLFESSESGSRFEGDFFNNPANENHPDGDYIVEVAIWTSVDENPIPYRLVFTHPDGSRDIHEGTVDPAIGFVDPVMITQTTDAEGNRTFVTTAL